jgi:hypothetical protein
MSQSLNNPVNVLLLSNHPLYTVGQWEDHGMPHYCTILLKFNNLRLEA